MEKSGFKVKLTDILLLVVTLVFFIGMQKAFAPCGLTEDGSFMNCHWAGNVISGLALVMLVIAVIHLLSRDGGIKKGLSISMIPLSVFAIITPNRLITLCMMPSMRCHAVMTPAVIIFSVITIVFAVLDVFVLKERD